MKRKVWREEGRVGKEEGMGGGRKGRDEVRVARKREGQVQHVAACTWLLPDVSLQPLLCAATLDECYHTVHLFNK